LQRQHPLDRLRALCLALPEATEKETWGSPTFRVRDKIFVMATAGEGQPSMWCKASPGGQEVLVGSWPERFYVPPYVGNRGWVGVRLGGRADWLQIADLIEESYRLTAPKRLVALLGP
jgi:predicted DNA-binding protein (MmcQ/YjbR family)